MRVLFYATILLFATVLTDAKRTERVQCRDENNKPVDWYVLYKLPKVGESSNPLIRKGLAYLYITNLTSDIGWQLSTKRISADDSIPANTLAPIYDRENANSTLWSLYSDSAPDTATNGKYGHAKGVVINDEYQGLWLVHSVPNFPPFPDGGENPRKRLSERNDSLLEPDMIDGKYSYPASGQNYGQSFLCMSLGDDQFDTVGKQLMYNQILVYSRNIPPRLAKKYPVLTDAINQVRIRDPPYTSMEVIKSLSGRVFTSFAKSDKWRKDLYDEFVAPKLRSDLMVSTWLNGRRRLPSDCENSKVYNVISVALKAANVVFSNSRDHSKWAVAVENKPQRNWVCIGDINRAETQYSRGGGTVCMNMLSIWKSYRSAVNDVEPCPKSYSRH